MNIRDLFPNFEDLNYDEMEQNGVLAVLDLMKIKMLNIDQGTNFSNISLK